MEANEGYILWLKKQSDLEPTLSQHYPLEKPQLYDHPVLVVRAAEGSMEVDVCLLTSQATASLFDHNLAIFPQTSLDSRVTQLRLADDVRLRKDGYVFAQEMYLVHTSMLESFAVVGRKLDNPLPQDIYQRHLEHGNKFRSLEGEVSRLRKVEIEYERQKERLRKLEAENVGLRQIEGETARLRLLYPEHESLQLLENFISWTHRVQGSRSAVGKIELAKSKETQLSPRLPPSKPTTEPADSK